VFVLSFFLLAFGDTLLKQAVESRDEFQHKRNIVQLLENVESGLSRYLGTITAINFGLGVATAIILWSMHIPNPILWGVMAATLNYVPHVGAFVCMAVLFVVGAVTHESLAYGAFAAGMFALLTATESYFVTPMVLSRSLQLSPLAVILAILFWGWLWGIAGGLMAAPLLAVLKIVADQFESMHDLSMVLSGTSAGPLRERADELPAKPAPTLSSGVRS
jgi:predicted PurR-regulated permease PerM